MVSIDRFRVGPDLHADPATERTVLVSVPFRTATELLAAVEWLRSHPQGSGTDAVLDIVDAAGRAGGVLQLERLERSREIAPDLPKVPLVMERLHLLCIRAVPSV